MALEEMLGALEKEGEADVEKIKSQARAHENQITKEADEEATRIRDSHRKKVEDQIRMERSKIINSANFHVKKEIIKVKESVLNQVFKDVTERAVNLRKEKYYDEVFRKLASETLNGINGKAIISVDPADEHLARSVLDKLGASYELNGNIKSLGGLKAQSEDGRIILNNTIDSRADKAKQLLKTDVLKVLFGDS